VRYLADDARDWLGRVVWRNGMTPVERARTSDDGLWAAEEALEHERRARHERLDWKAKLERDIDGMFVDPQRRRLAKTTGYPQLPGRVSLIVHCRDEATYRQCLAILNPKSGGLAR
jgi:hypothetical protein